MYTLRHVGAKDPGNVDVALVTGGGRGIGRAIARRLARDGLAVAVADIAGDAPDAMSREQDSSLRNVTMDVRVEASVEDAFRAVEAELGPIRVLVANAGVLLTHPDGSKPPLWDLESSDWDETFAVNARGTFLCCRALLRRRRANPVPHGRIVTLTSVAAQLGGLRSSASYIASKSAIIGLTKACAREAAPLGITANAIAPGLIDAPMLHQTSAGSTIADAARAVPLQRLGTVDDVAACAAFLASVESGYMTGAVLDVNGGYRMQ